MTNAQITGGCQCGAVRFSISGALTWAHLCHCRMCQKASGNYFMPLANAQKHEFKVTRGTVAWFASSDVTRRGFCSDCGTPLIFETLDATHLNITLGSLDDPASVMPDIQYGLEAKMPWFSGLDGLSGSATEDASGPDAEQIEKIRRSNHQHPDHDTAEWPVRPHR
ncbi:MAG: GFA family protein [Hyphomicrobiales bacterium]|nr:GFA family protein [Hyphomicrobiales bacterium]MCP5000691.1 GFA family protein [Hyphomicrobiales bacterium]